MVPNRLISHKQSYFLFVTLVISALLLASCGSPVSLLSTLIPPSPTPLVPQATATTGPATATPEVVQATPEIINPTDTPQESLPTDTATPVLSAATPQAVPTSVPITGSIAFVPGATAGIVQGSVTPGQVVTYTLGAGQSQGLILIMTSPNNDVTLGLLEPNGNKLIDPASKWTRWQGMLPATELYTIQVIGGATTESFILTVKIPQQINFASGSSSSTINGTTVSGYLFLYSLNASAGQTMTASLNVPASTAYLDIYGLTSGTLLSASALSNSWTGSLPATQTYVIEVVPNNGQVVNYALTVAISGVAGSSSNSIPSASSPGSIVFAPNTTAAVSQGIVQAGQTVTYTAQANAFQPMILVLESSVNDISLGVLDPNGSTLLSPSKKWRNWQWVLPTTGVYTINIVGGAVAEKYTLTTKIPKLLSINSGPSSITYCGTNHLGFIQSYAIRLAEGDVPHISLDVPASKAYLDIYGLQTGSLLSYTSKSTSWSGSLPLTDTYIIEVLPRGGYLTSYCLTISLP
jgi:hypothetical protein